MIRSFTDSNFVETLYWDVLRKHFWDVYFSPVHYVNSQIYSRQTYTFNKVMSIQQIFLFLNSFLRWIFACVAFTFSSSPCETIPDTKIFLLLLLLLSLLLLLLLDLRENTVTFYRKTPVLKSSTQVFSCEIWEIFKNTFFYRTPVVAASY